jgi:hypothetical protein
VGAERRALDLGCACLGHPPCGRGGSVAVWRWLAPSLQGIDAVLTMPGPAASLLLVAACLSCHVTMTAQSSSDARDLAGGGGSSTRRLIYPTKKLWRSNKCLPDAVDEKYFLYYNGTAHNVSIAYANWASARILAEISYILISEVLGFKSHLFDTAAIYSSHPINYAAGCVDGDDLIGETCDVSKPLVHLTVETWMAGYRRTRRLPRNVKPVLLATLEYPLLDEYFIWPDVRDSGIESVCSTLLDDYRAYQTKNNSLCPHPSIFFDPWQEVYAKLKAKSAGGTSLVRSCTIMDSDDISDRDTARYTQLTGDTGVQCQHEDAVWFSKSCRHNNSLCVPLVIQYTMDFAMQISYFLDMPLAVMMVESGVNGDYSEYYELITGGKLMFGWYTPDDNLLRFGRMPVSVRMPSTNKIEHQKSIFKTGLGVNQPRNFAWRSLPAVSPHVTLFGQQVSPKP